MAAEMLGSLQVAFSRRAAPRVRALHLPPKPWTGNKDGEFGALELDSGAMGLSYLLLDDTFAHIGGHGTGWTGADPLALARLWVDDRSPAEAALGFAAINALSRELMDRAGYAPPDATDSIGGLDPQAGERIGMVGYFPPLVRQVLVRGAALTVLELRADLVGAREGFRITLDPAELADCTQVLCTSTVLLNHTLDGVLAACRSVQRLVLLGPGAGCLPDALFARGVSALAGTWVEDGPAFCRALAVGDKWSAAARKMLIRRDQWPGVEALVVRAGA